MTQQTKPLLASNSFIVLSKYDKKKDSYGHYQTEADLEKEFIYDLIKQGYEFLPHIKKPEALIANARKQLQRLNKFEFTDKEWQRFLEEYLDSPKEGAVEKTRKIQVDYMHDFKLDSGEIKNIYLVKKTHLAENKLQIIQQFEQKGKHTNRYDVTLLVNGLPLVQIELKKRSVPIRGAFHQIHRYGKESFNSEHSLYKYVQLFVISNGTDTRYFANTTKRDKNSFDFTTNWATADNIPIKDLKDFTATFFQQSTLLGLLLHYSIFDSNDALLVMRPYQIAATERLLWKLKSSHNAKNHSKRESGGYIWHSTGSGKTLTSFKAARLATELDFIDKVFFVVDRKDLDYQTMKEYQRFCPDSVNGSANTAGLKENIAKDDNKIIVTTIQKLNNLMKSEKALAIYNKQVVFIFDECHRSQFGEAQKNIKKNFKTFYQFGFTGTPIFSQNSIGDHTTSNVFGPLLHSYIITDAIRDEKVLKFKVDYNDVRPKFKKIENEQDEKKLSQTETKRAFLHPQRIEEISQYILNNFHQKTHRTHTPHKGFNALFAVDSIQAAKLYYETLNGLQKTRNNPIKIATIFSFNANEENAIGEIADESFEISALNSTAKEFLSAAIKDYNSYFGSNFSVDNAGFETYYRDLAKRVKDRDVDLLIVVGMFLTGFDAPTLNTLFVDKNLRYHGLIQAYSRTNRIYNATKTFGNIITFRNLEPATIDAIKLFGSKEDKYLLLEKSYKDYMEGVKDTKTGELHAGFLTILQELEQRFPNHQEIFTEADRKSFVQLFGKYLRLENILQNYDEFTALKALQTLDIEDATAVQEFKESHYLDEEGFAQLKNIKLPSKRQIQDYKSTYNDILDWVRHEKVSKEMSTSTLDWDGVEFEVELLKSEEINLDYILEQIYNKSKNINDKATLLEDIISIIRSSFEHRPKENLLIAFIEKTKLNKMRDKKYLSDEFYLFAQEEQKRDLEQLIHSENLNKELAERYILRSVKRKLPNENGTQLHDILPRMSPLNPQYRIIKKRVLAKIAAFVDKYKGLKKEISPSAQI